MAKKKETVEQTPVAAEVSQEQKKDSTKDIIVKLLLKTGRERMEDLIAEMEEIGFFTAPASGGNHSNAEGGLAEHSLNVLNIAEKIGVALLGGEWYNAIQNSVIIASLLHDLGKCGDFGKQLYVPNILKSGKQSDAKPWKRNPDLTNIPHGIRSVILAERWVDLTEDEEYAICYHDGLYEPSNVAVIKSHETQLFMILHWADMWCSRVVEGVSEESEGE